MSKVSGAFVVPNSERPGQTAIRRNADHPAEFVDRLYPNVVTLYDIFQKGFELSGDGPCYGVRSPNGGPYVWQTYRQVNQRITHFGSGLIRMIELLERPAEQVKDDWRDVQEKNSSTTKTPAAITIPQVKPVNKISRNIGLYSVNRAEWAVGEQACNAYNLVSVALYDTLGESTLDYILNHAQLSIVVCSTDKIGNLLKIAHKCPCLKVIISMDNLNPKTPSSTLQLLKDWSKERDLKLFDFSEVEHFGSKSPRKHIPPKPTDLCTICYTSGTTDIPKGALLTHRNVVADISSGLQIINATIADVHISYLPLAHIYERIFFHGLIMCGARVGFYRGDVNGLIDDVAELRPTFFVSVPRLFNRIHAKLVANTIKAPGAKGILARQAFKDKKEYARKYKTLKHAVWDKIIFGKVAAVMGGRIRLLISASAPISADVVEFMRLAFSCDLLEAYGSTENAGAATLTQPGDFTVNHIGIPMSCNEIKLVDVPEMNYLATDKPFARGEICLRGPNIFVGYLNDQKKTSEALDSEGWLHTGDVGIWNERGTLTIIDRKKNIFKLAQGEYIAVEKVENAYQKSSLVGQIFVHGDSLKSELVAVVVPNQENLITWAKGKGLGDDFFLLSRNSQVKTAIMESMDKAAKSAKLKGFELVKEIFVEPFPFAIENDLLTPSFKLKRPQALKRYKEEIDRMYRILDAKKEPVVIGENLKQSLSKL